MDRDIHFRRMTSSIFRRLSAEDVQQIAYVRLKGKEDTKKYSAVRPQASSVDLLESLEQYNYFSQDNIEGLKEVLRDAGRVDLVKQVDAEMRKLEKLRNVDKKAALEGLSLAAPATTWREESGWVHVSDSETVPSLRGKDRYGASDGQTTGSKSSGTLNKKVPMLPLKRATQETASLSKTPEVQQLVTSPSPARKGATSLKPLPPPPPPKIVLRSSSRDAEKNGENTERDSGLWTGESAYDTVTEWTKHHTQPLPEVVEVSQYQSLGAKDPVDDHQYASLEICKEEV